MLLVLIGILCFFLFRQHQKDQDKLEIVRDAQSILISQNETYKDKLGLSHSVALQAQTEITILKRSKDSLQRKIYTLYSQLPKKQQRQSEGLIGASMNVSNSIPVEVKKTDSGYVLKDTCFNDNYFSACFNQNSFNYNYSDTLMLFILNYKDKWKFRNIFHKRIVKNKVDASLTNKNAVIKNIIFIKK